MFLTYDRVFPAGATEADLVRIIRPRPGLPVTAVTLGGQPRLAWTTFTPHQIDLDVRHPAARRYLSEVLARLAGCGVRTVRLDAVGYTVKTAGTSCFLTPETVDFVIEIAAEARSMGLQVLSEVHAHHRYSGLLAPHVDRVYDFAFAPLVLHAVLTGDGGPMRRWLRRRPANAVTVLDTHDGIGLVDAGPGREPADAGLLSGRQLEELAAAIAANSGGTSRASRVWAGRDGGIYQVSCTAYDAVGGDDRRCLLTRLLQLFVPGIPQVYYVGLLAGRNQPYAGGDAREINRRRYTEAEVAAALRQPVVAELAELIRLRNRHPAFGGAFRVLDGPTGELGLAWTAEGAGVELQVDFGTGDFQLTEV
jgi:sucrose phosphorylase